jgi:hypothetical protein
MFNIFVLKCMQNTYYIGITNNNFFKIKDYKEENEWTQQFKPIFLHKFYLNKTEEDLYNITLNYMSIYGINDVRTNDFNTYILSENDIIKLNCDINKRYD